VRAAHAAVGPARRHRRPERGPLHAAQAGGPDGEGRADALRPLAAVSDEERRPGDGVPHPRVRLVVRVRPAGPQCILLGDQSQPGRDAGTRVAVEEGPGRHGRVPLQLRRGIERQHRRAHPRPARGGLRRAASRPTRRTT
jgi:hypothetical protein